MYKRMEIVYFSIADDACNCSFIYWKLSRECCDHLQEVKTFQICRPYVIIEIDDPGQRVRTEAIDMNNTAFDFPQWNQEFSL